MKVEIEIIAPNISRQRWKDTAWSHRLIEFKKMYIKHEDVKMAINVIDRKLQEIDDTCVDVESEDYLKNPETLGSGLMLIGESGSGKSSLAKHMLRRHQRVNTPTQTFVPAVYMRIPPNVSPKSMAQALLTGLGHKDTKGTAKDLLERAIALCRKCGVKIIMIDDFQDIPARRVRGIATIGDWVRQLIDAVPALIIAMGTPSAEVVRDSNEQVQRRMQATARLSPFVVDHADPTDSWAIAETGKSTKRWSAILAEIDDNLPMAEKSNLDDPMISALLLRASNASISHLIKVLQHSMEVAVEMGKECISNEHFRLGFSRTFGTSAENGNPFDDDYDGSPLSLPGQAFFKCVATK